MVVEDWGIVPYAEALERQRTLFRELIADPSGEERLILCQHYPVFTVGRHGDMANMLADSAALRRLGAEVVRIERGGDITYHGPGQLVVYPIINLNRHRLGVKAYVHLLERAVCETLAAYGIAADSNDDQIGVWLDWGSARARKICAIGVKISHGITMHGLALNVNTDMSPFRLINPCGITDKDVTSMALESGHEIPLAEVADTFQFNFRIREIEV